MSFQTFNKCFACDLNKHSEAFSASQLAKGNYARCKGCVAHKRTTPDRNTIEEKRQNLRQQVSIGNKSCKHCFLCDKSKQNNEFSKSQMTKPVPKCRECIS